ncbi:MAG: Porphyromonas-type peptidyl-arginine deiminase [Planctomycetota bacterium]
MPRPTPPAGLLLLLCAALPLRPACAQVRGFPEASAEIRTLLLQYDAEVAGDLFPAWRDLARELPQPVRIVLACGESSARAGARLAEHAGFAADRVRCVITEGPPTVWARDRVLALAGQDPGTIELLTPDPDMVEIDLLPDLQVSEALSAEGERFLARPSRLHFAGGDLLFSAARPIAGPHLLLANLDRVFRSEADAFEELARLLGAEPLIIGRKAGVPHEHCDMFLTVLGPDSVLLGNPISGAAWLEDLLDAGLPSAVMPLHDQWEPETTRREAPVYKAIREELVAAGIEVRSIPILVGQQGSFLTWNNAVLERRPDGVHAYVPRYGIAALDEAAFGVYAEAGIVPHPIDVARLAQHGGTVRCITNVLEWQGPATGVR